MDPDALQELKEKWEKHDRMLDTSIRLNRRLLCATNLNRTRSSLERLCIGLALEALVQLGGIVAIGSFEYSHRADPKYLLPAVALHLFGIVTLIALIRPIALALQVDYSGPIAAIQKRIADLRIMRIRYIQGTLLTAMLVWTPLLIVVWKGIFGRDAYRDFGTAYLAANLLVGLLAIPAALWLTKQFSNRFGRYQVVHRLMRDIAGYNLRAATDSLASLSEFENET